MSVNWVVNIKGGPEKMPFEIAILRDCNEHGKKSYGWFDENKILISHNGGPCCWPVPEIVWNRLIEVAYEVATELNDLEAGRATEGGKEGGE